MSHEFIYKLYPNVVTIRGDVAYDADDNVVEIDNALVQAEADKYAYRDLRAQNYPSFAEQFDLIYHGGIDAWKQAIDEVKQKYPKP
jgi:hypothetical protein